MWERQRANKSTVSPFITSAELIFDCFAIKTHHTRFCPLVAAHPRSFYGEWLKIQVQTAFFKAIASHHMMCISILHSTLACWIIRDRIAKLKSSLESPTRVLASFSFASKDQLNKLRSLISIEGEDRIHTHPTALKSAFVGFLRFTKLTKLTVINSSLAFESGAWHWNWLCGELRKRTTRTFYRKVSRWVKRAAVAYNENYPTR